MYPKLPYVVFIALAIIIVYYVTYASIGNNKLRRLLDGDQDVRLAQVRLWSFAGEVTLTDPEDLAYFEQRMRECRETDHEYWQLIRVAIEFEGIGGVHMDARISGSVIAITKPGQRPIGLEYFTHDIVIDERAPEELRDFLATTARTR